MFLSAEAYDSDRSKLVTMNLNVKAPGDINLKAALNVSAGLNVDSPHPDKSALKNDDNYNLTDDDPKHSGVEQQTVREDSSQEEQQVYTFSEEEITGNELYPLKFKGGNHQIVITRAGTAHIVRLIGLTFDSNKCFLLPYSLPGIRAIAEMHTRFPEAEVLIAGHDGGDEELKGVDLACCRAEILAAYLQNDRDAWLKWFSKSISSKIRWGIREVQLMLSSLPEGETPFFIGNASGVTNQKTTDAVKAFQKYWNTQRGGNLKVDGIAGPKTQKELVTAYMDIENTTISKETPIKVHGCEGAFEDDLTLQGMQPDERIIEVFFFEKGINPLPVGKTSTDGSTDYFKWKKQVIETKNFEFHGIHVQVIDKKKKPVKFAKVFLDGPTQCQSHTDEQGFAFFSGLIKGEYIVRAEKPGMDISSSVISYPTAKTLSRKSSGK
jgi:outer membrane protein OmpA-like peptidoglycan-associated protein